MIQQLKLVVKLLSFSFRPVLTFVGGIIVLLSGIVIDLLVPQKTLVFGVAFIATAPIWFVQLLFSLNMSEFVQASPMKKALQTKLPVQISFVSAILSYLTIIVLGEVKCLLYPWLTHDDLVTGRLFGAAMILLILCYCGVCYKYFISSTIFYIICMDVFMVSVTSGELSFARCPLVVGTMIGFVLIFLGCFLEYGLFSFTYKKQLAKLAQYPGLRSNGF